jgi:hypothetical protein
MTRLPPGWKVERKKWRKRFSITASRILNIADDQAANDRQAQ